MQFELYQTVDEHWHWRLRDDEGRVIAVSSTGEVNKKRVYAVIDAVLSLERAEILDKSE